MSMVIFACSDYPKVSQVIVFVDSSVDYMLHFSGKRPEWLNVEMWFSVSVCCGGIWGLTGHLKPGEGPEDRGRELCQSGEFFTVALNVPLLFCVWWFSLCCFVPCNNVPWLSSIWELNIHFACVPFFRWWSSKRNWRGRVRSWCRPPRPIKLYRKPSARSPAWPRIWRHSGWSTRARSVYTTISYTWGNGEHKHLYRMRTLQACGR